MFSVIDHPFSVHRESFRTKSNWEESDTIIVGRIDAGAANRSRPCWVTLGSPSRSTKMAPMGMLDHTKDFILRVDRLTTWIELGWGKCCNLTSGQMDSWRAMDVGILGK